MHFLIMWKKKCEFKYNHRWKALIGWKTKFLINLQWNKSLKIQYFCLIGQKITKWPPYTLPFQEYQKCTEWHHIKDG